ncbi:hypothetical protein LTR78_005985 [Recurvomyces mirabilis]|uniref:Cytochrome P450 n=1 Tax=Recurvomyces mirabilis TaxID=574656 RepID=A0AAE1C0N3_9PEZI|nr:hypothetical protein LTR78_005985 [Recurvomyces mirabilis]KAK5155204.1 hypothetical protein LTS14_006159 [Recurvomyces mirabilis]
MAYLPYITSVLVTLIVYRLFTNWAHLRQAPGPFLASLTDLWRAWYQYNGKLRGELLKLHQQHGPIVRYGVRSISISDPSVVNVVYGSRAGFTTADSYNVLIGISNGKEVASLVSTNDEARHGALRRSVAGAFTQTNVMDYEPHVHESILELLELLSRKSTMDLAQIMLYYTMDSAARFAFAEPLGCLASGTDVGGSIQTIRDRFNHWGWWSSIPALERLVYRNPIALRSKRALSSMAATAVKKLQDRASKPQATGQTPDLLTRFLESSRANPDVLDKTGIIGMLMSTISGAGDTTATTVNASLYWLMKHPDALARLRQELMDAQIDRPVPQYNQVSKLLYLNAVIKESMRLFPTAVWPIERRVPEGGATIAGVQFPEGTSVGCLVIALHLNPSVFGQDAQQFRPERWLTEDADMLKKMEQAHMGFSRGRRVCLGQHIAVLQIKKVIPALVMGFEISLVDPHAELKADFSPAVACLEPLMVKVQRRR